MIISNLEIVKNESNYFIKAILRKSKRKNALKKYLCFRFDEIYNLTNNNGIDFNSFKNIINIIEKIKEFDWC